jgi:hypothetical protein
MICPNLNCGAEMIQIPSTIKVKDQIIGDPNMDLYKCPACKRIGFEMKDGKNL